MAESTQGPVDGPGHCQHDGSSWEDADEQSCLSNGSHSPYFPALQSQTGGDPVTRSWIHTIHYVLKIIWKKIQNLVVAMMKI